MTPIPARIGLSKLRWKKVSCLKKIIELKRCTILCLNVATNWKKKKSLFNGKNSKKIMFDKYMEFSSEYQLIIINISIPNPETFKISILF